MGCKADGEKAQKQTGENSVEAADDSAVVYATNVQGLYPPQGCSRREGTSEAAPAAVRAAVGGNCQSGWGRLLSVTNAIEAGTWRQGDGGWA